MRAVHVARRVAGFGWIVQVGLGDIAFRGSCIAGHGYVLRGYSPPLPSNPPVATLELPVGFLTRELFLGLL